jgi:glycogen phosphorylase
VAAQVWSVNVGRLKLFLLDTNIAQDNDEDRKITYQLYGGDLEMRLKQEILLGIGGYRTLEAIGLTPTVYHMNEGHSAFLGLERVVRPHGDPKTLFPGSKGPCLGESDVHDSHSGRRGP